jgi:CubicO group peptidase (beta-lactamase class C family)
MDSPREAIDRRVPDLMSRYSVPGVSIALVDDGELVWSRGYGESIDDDSVFQVASISKTVTAWAVMNLVERGDVSLDSPVIDHVSWEPPPSRFDEREMTVRRLLSHTAGLSVSGVEGVESRSDLASTKDGLEGKRDNPVVRMVDSPGRDWRYSGGGYGVLQLLLEESYDEPFAEVMRKEVLEPLGMKDSSFDPSERLRNRLPVAKSFDGSAATPEHYVLKAAAGLNTTARDLARFVTATIDPESQEVLEPRTVRQMFEPAPNTAGMYGALADAGYGLGYATEGLASEKTLAMHTGANPGWASLLAVVPEERAGLVVLTNADSGILLYADLLCDWVASVSGEQFSLCRSVSGIRATTMIFWSLVGIAVLFLAAYIGKRGTKREKRRRGVILASLIGAAAALWILVWHVFNLGGVTVAEVISARFWPVTLLMVIASIALLVSVSRSQVPVRRLVSLTFFPAVVAWILVAHTDYLGRLVLGNDELLLRNSFPRVTWTITAVLFFAAAWRVLGKRRRGVA